MISAKTARGIADAARSFQDDGYAEQLDNIIRSAAKSGNNRALVVLSDTIVEFAVTFLRGRGYNAESVGLGIVDISW
jgi:hypothetical protein